MLKRLIEEGEALKKQIKNTMGFEILSGEDYEKWIAKCIDFLEDEYPSATNTKRFIEASKNAAGQSISRYNRMLGIIKGIEENKLSK